MKLYININKCDTQTQNPTINKALAWLIAKLLNCSSLRLLTLQVNINNRKAIVGTADQRNKCDKILKSNV